MSGASAIGGGTPVKKPEIKIDDTGKRGSSDSSEKVSAGSVSSVPGAKQPISSEEVNALQTVEHVTSSVDGSEAADD